MNETTWVSLPVEQAKVESLKFSGYGKRSEIKIKTSNKPTILVPTHDLKIAVNPETAAEIRIRALDDLSLEQTIQWPEDQVPKLEVAKIEWFDSIEDWQEWLEEYKNTPCNGYIEVNAYVDLYLKLS